MKSQVTSHSARNLTLFVGVDDRMNVKQIIITVLTLLALSAVYLCQPEISMRRQYPSAADMEKTQREFEQKYGHASITWARPPLDIIIRLHGIHDETKMSGYQSPQTGAIAGVVLCFGLVGILQQQVSRRRNKEKGKLRSVL